MASNGISPNFPAGLRVLIVDDDASILKKLLLKCNYEVWTSKLTNEALGMLGEKNEKHNFNIVIIDVNIGDNDAFQLIQYVARKLDLPVIMTAKDGESSCVIKGIQSGACNYLSKPVGAKEAQFIWQHVYRKKMSTQHQNLGDEGIPNPMGEIVLPVERNKREIGECSYQGGGGGMAVKKTRIIWTPELHSKFEKAVAEVKSAKEKMGPKKILEFMGETGLTREQIASHLQKYRDKNNGVAATQVSDTNTHPQQLSQLVQQQNTMIGENCEEQSRMQAHITIQANYMQNMNSYGAYTNAYRPPSNHHGMNIENSCDSRLLSQFHNNTQNVGFNAHQNQNQNPPNLGAYSNNDPITRQNPHNLSAYGNNGPNAHQILNSPNFGAYGNNNPNTSFSAQDYDSSSYDGHNFQQ